MLIAALEVEQGTLAGESGSSIMTMHILQCNYLTQLLFCYLDITPFSTGENVV